MAVYKKILITVIVMATVPVALYWREIRWTIRYFAVKDVAYVAPAAEIPACPRCNLILISLDTLRADRLGFLGGAGGLTPHFDQIASKSLVFENAFANAFYTTPSHMTVFTSLYPQQHQVEGDEIKVPRMPRAGTATPLSPNVPTLPEVLKQAGYYTTWAGPKELKHLDPDLGFGRGFDLRMKSVFVRPIEKWLDASRDFLATEFFEALTSRRPHFAFLHSYIAHMPFVQMNSDLSILQPEQLVKAFAHEAGMNPERIGLENAEEIAICADPGKSQRCAFEVMDSDVYFHTVGQLQLHRLHSDEVSEKDLKNFVEAYNDQVRELDRQIGELWRRLEESGILKDTVVAIFSDHGEELFDHGKASHSSFYDHTLRVPLVIYHPGIKGVRFQHMVSLVDLLPSLLKWLDVPEPKHAQGALLLARSDEPVMGYSLGNSFARDRNWKLIRKFDGREELYYLPLDPKEKENLIMVRLPWTQAAYRRLSQALADLEAKPGF